MDAVRAGDARLPLFSPPGQAAGNANHQQQARPSCHVIEIDLGNLRDRRNGNDLADLMAIWAMLFIRRAANYDALTGIDMLIVIDRHHACGVRIWIGKLPDPASLRRTS